MAYQYSSPITVRVFDDVKQVGVCTADRLCDRVRGKPDSFLGMATGSTPKVTGFWEELRRRVKNDGLDLSEATFVNPDEWIGLTSGHSEAYRTYLEKELSNCFETNVLVPYGNAEDPIAASVEVERKILNGGGFQFMLLGMGINGHIGFFEPNADGLPSGPFLPEIDLVNRQRYAKDHFGSIEKVPTHATTIGLGMVMRAKEMVLCVVGDKKSELLARAIQGPVTTSLPASLIQLGGDVKIFVDSDAAKHLDLQALALRPGWAVVDDRKKK